MANDRELEIAKAVVKHCTCSGCIAQALIKYGQDRENEAYEKAALIVKNHTHKMKWVDDLNNGDEVEVPDCECESEIITAIRNLKRSG